ncbi:hypothetical protein UFOVP71_385 [uncultured Caudovirales phage]|uniref:Uncharacterized protein n=1 Tax=uncultured Caudovirales phage TaxID=2100421 RepID=A0A6J5TD45_9CAUD|nr:hypothetical protein UFOVP71_385 [uncultured Caudovirales phage]
MKIVWGRSIGWNIELNKMVRLTRPIPNGRPMEYSIITDGADCYPWHKVYAWWPVKTVNGERVWLEKVLKRKVWVVWGTGFHMEPETQYATMFDRITIDDDKPFKK